MSLSPYTIVVGTKEDSPYNVIPNAPIEIRKRSDGLLATIYSDEAGTTPITQPGATADDRGTFIFYAAADGYNALYNGITQPIDTGITSQVFSQAARVVPFDTLDQAINETSPLKIFEGAALNIKERTTGNGGGAMWDVVDIATSGVVPNGDDIVACVGVPALALVLRTQLISYESKNSIIFGEQQFENSDFNSGNSVVLAYWAKGQENSNVLTGTQSFRYLFGGYDNLIEGQTPAELDGLACGHIATHHSEIRGQSNHTVVVGGSFNILNDAWYSFCGGTQNTQLPRTSLGYSAYNFIGGILNTVQGNSNSVFGSNNVLEDEVNGAHSSGSANTIKGSFGATFGQSNTLNGDDSFAVGNGNIVGSRSAASGRANNLGSSNYSTVQGELNTNTADYSRTMGRGAFINAAHDHSDVHTHLIDSLRSYTIRLPLKLATTTGVGFSVFTSILGDPAVLSIEPDMVITFSIMVSASTDDMVNVAAFEVSGFARKVGAGVIEILAENITEVYNTDVGQLQVSMVTGASANLQLSASQGTVVNPVKWTAYFTAQTRKVI